MSTVASPVLGKTVIGMAQSTNIAGGSITVTNSAGISATGTFEILKQTSVVVASGVFGNDNTVANTQTPAIVLPPSILNFIDRVDSTDVSNGSIQYIVRLKANTSTTTVTMSNTVIKAVVL